MSTRKSSVRYRNIPGFPGYQAGSDGSIWSLWRFYGRNAGWQVTSERRHRLKANPMHSGHLKVTLYDGFSRRHRYVHFLVLITFKGPRPPGKESRHKNGNPADNRPANLHWGTHLQNSRDRERHGRVPRGSTNGKSKLSSTIVFDVLRRWRVGEIAREIATVYGVEKQAVYGILKGRTWSHITGITKRRRIIPRDWRASRAETQNSDHSYTVGQFQPE